MGEYICFVAVGILTAAKRCDQRITYTYKQAFAYLISLSKSKYLRAIRKYATYFTALKHRTNPHTAKISNIFFFSSSINFVICTTLVQGQRTNTKSFLIVRIIAHC